jgi:hypothetical protein
METGTKTIRDRVLIISRNDKETSVSVRSFIRKGRVNGISKVVITTITSIVVISAPTTEPINGATTPVDTPASSRTALEYSGKNNLKTMKTKAGYKRSFRKIKNTNFVRFEENNFKPSSTLTPMKLRNTKNIRR